MDKYEKIGVGVGIILIAVWLISLVYLIGYTIIFWWNNDGYTAIQVFKYIIHTKPFICGYLLCIMILASILKKE